MHANDLERPIRMEPITLREALTLRLLIAAAHDRAKTPGPKLFWMKFSGNL
jgi:hypothetical protein